jgi:protein-disulfide isomerase
MNWVQCVLTACVAVAGLSCCAAASPGCAPVSQSRQDALVRYLRTKFKFSDAAKLSIARIEALPNCSYRLLLEREETAFPKTFTIMLSADQRYLARELFDTSLDPALEESAALGAASKALEAGKYPYAGPGDAKNVLVVFSDFQCPYCKEGERVVSDLLASGDPALKVVYRNFPLPNHPWARQAAEAASCAFFQGNDFFWRVHGYLFEHQKTITVANLRLELNGYLGTLSGFDMPSYANCIANNAGGRHVDADVALAATVEVGGTPTYFLNGKRVAAQKSVEQWKSLLAH